MELLSTKTVFNSFYAQQCAKTPRPTASLRYFCDSLAPNAVDGNEHALSRLHRVEHRTLHCSVAGAAHGNGHVVLCLKSVPDPLFDFIHNLWIRRTKKVNSTRIKN